MKHTVSLSAVLLASAASLGAQANRYDDSLLARVQVAGRSMQGDLPSTIHFVTFAESSGPLARTVDGADSTPVAFVYSVFQIRFPRGWIMVDAGFSHDVWAARPSNRPPTYRQDQYDQVVEALRHADHIVLTHEHWDHAAGVERPYDRAIIARTLLTPAQRESITDTVVPFYVHLSADSAAAYPIVDYDLVHALAPGVVLIKAPGHTPGAQLVYVRLASGQEVLLIGDLVWNMKGLELNRQKPDETIRRIHEDRAAIQQQIDWVRQVSSRNGLIVVASHDGQWLDSLVARGVLRHPLDVRR